MMDKTYVDETLRGHCETTANTSHGAHIPWTQHHIPNVRGQNIHGQNNNAPKILLDSLFKLINKNQFR